MISSACTSRNRSPTLIASRSRRLCRSATAWTIFSRSALLTLAPARTGRSDATRRRARSTATSSRAGSTGFSR